MLGHEFVGRIVQVGTSVKDWKVGERVVAPPVLVRDGRLEWFGESSCISGAASEFCLIEASVAVRVPTSMSTSAAVLAEPLAVALHAIARGQIAPRDAVVVVGAGALGILTSVALSILGAPPVALIEKNPKRLEMARSVGIPVFETLWQVDLSRWSPPDALTDALDAASLLPQPSQLWPRAVFIECAGSEGVMGDIVEVAPRSSRIVGVGLTAGDVQFEHSLAVTKQLELIFTVVYNKDYFEQAIAMLNSFQEKFEATLVLDIARPEASAFFAGRAKNAHKTVLEISV